MNQFLVGILVLSFGLEAFAAPLCADLIVFNEDPAALEQEAADLFQRAESEVDIQLHFSGMGSRFMDADLADELRSMIQRLQGLPGSHQSFIPKLNDLVDVSSGQINIRTY